MNDKEDDGSSSSFISSPINVAADGTTDPNDAKNGAYSMPLNDVELGGGSIPIVDQDRFPSTGKDPVRQAVIEAHMKDPRESLQEVQFSTDRSGISLHPKEPPKVPPKPQTRWTKANSGGVIAGFASPTQSIRAEQQEYNKNLAATLMATKMAIRQTQQHQQKLQEQQQQQASSGRAGGPRGSMIKALSRQFSVQSRNASADSSHHGSTLQHSHHSHNLFRKHSSLNTAGSGAAWVLVNLQLLNIAQEQTTTDPFETAVDSKSRQRTTIPVNQHGFAAGQGRTPEERAGPYRYLLCLVKGGPPHGHHLALHHAAGTAGTDHGTNGGSSSSSSHGQVTVERCDNQSLQVLGVGWEIHRLEDPVAIEAARAAAETNTADHLPGSSHRRLRRSLQELPGVARLRTWRDATIVPCLSSARSTTRKFGTRLVRGESPFSCKVRITGINLLVLCSTLFLFLQVVQLAFLSARWDNNIKAIGLIIWLILVLELLFEFMIRPSDYRHLVRSEKAYWPSTARYISNMFLFWETFALVLYVPELICLRTTTDVCLGSNAMLAKLTLLRASARAVVGPTMWDSLLGRLVVGATALRFFGVVRHWRQMLIRQLFFPSKRYGLEKWVIPHDPNRALRKQLKQQRLEKKQHEENDDDTVDSDHEADMDFTESKESRRLKSAANIGTALIVVNSQRALILMVLSVLVLPLFFSFSHQNKVAINLTKILESENLVSTSGFRDCEYLETAIDSWLNMAVVNPLIDDDKIGSTYVLYAQVLPVRCPFQNQTGVITSCTGKQKRFQKDFGSTCEVWDNANPPPLAIGDTKDFRNYYAKWLDIRGGGIFVNQQPPSMDHFHFEALNEFRVTVAFNQNHTIQLANINEFILLVIVFFLGLFFLTILQKDVADLALTPIKRMLNIVVRYAENPLSSDVDKNMGNKKMVTRDSTTPDDIGDIETEQLLSAITKISDLLRKCWGVAGAGIISSNLGRQKDGQVAIFNPTVPGKLVYALFGFVCLGGYSELLKSLDKDIMILINDIAKVVHDEVYRWALGEHGQCNKNLGQAFLMVWRIGDFSEVQKKNKAAIEKMFQDKVYKTSKTNSNLRRRGNRTLYSGRRNVSNFSTTKRRTNSSMSSHGIQEFQLESLPGIQDFADRALLGMLKSFAGIHREKSLQEWKNDFRLTAGVSALSYTVDIIYGMDAGWAVEGAVGSEYKIDATYLSPHVNMASRMMSASKQYGATILVSKAVEKILSKPCRSKLRHLDTVYVKGSAIKQGIYTYDARYQGVDFFLWEQPPDIADREAELYTSSIWETDQDLLAMRRHATEDFQDTYHKAVNHYLAGRWSEAYQSFEEANDLMIRTVVEEGYLELEDEALENRVFDKTDQRDDVVRIRNEFGDGACRTLMSYIERRNFEAPKDWDGVRQLFSK